MSSLIFPNWPIPLNVKACTTKRCGGVSLPPYDSLNLADHVGDDYASVTENRRLLMEYAKLPTAPIWLEQVHGTRVLRLTDISTQQRNVQVDAVYSNSPSQVCAVMTADCLPVLFCATSGDEVAAAHAGWRGLSSGVLEQTLAQFSSSPSTILVWLGPAIGPKKFEVGEDVRQAFIDMDAIYSAAFVQSKDKYLADIYQLARLRLEVAGIHRVYGGHYCTVSDSQQFFSYRREGITGRQASLIWLT